MLKDAAVVPLTRLVVAASRPEGAPVCGPPGPPGPLHRQPLSILIFGEVMFGPLLGLLIGLLSVSAPSMDEFHTLGVEPTLGLTPECGESG